MVLAARLSRHNIQGLIAVRNVKNFVNKIICIVAKQIFFLVRIIIILAVLKCMINSTAKP